jgi:hypothetical protein
MKKQIMVTAFLLIATLTLSQPIAFAVNNPNIPDNQGTSKVSNALPEQSKVPQPVIDLDGDDYGDFVEGCRARGDDVAVFIPGVATWLGGPCCASNMETAPESGVYFPNQCCTPPDFVGEPAVPGNHCLCFLLRGYISP